MLVSRALQLHPTAPPLFILASAHELDQLSPSSSRSLLQRGLRLNPESIELWTEYVKMELTYIESLRRRWAVLGIDATDTKGKKKGDGETGAPTPDDESDESRRQVMQGAIVLAVMASAVKGSRTAHVSFLKLTISWATSTPNDPAIFLSPIPSHFIPYPRNSAGFTPRGIAHTSCPTPAA